MKNTIVFSTIFGIAILLMATVAIPMELGQTADAAKAKGVSNSKYGEATKKVVCGDRLCSEDPSDKMKKHGSMHMKTSDSTATSTPVDIGALVDKMNAVHERHQLQIMQMWETMTPQQQAQMAHKMEQMISKMESKDGKDLMQGMDMMMKEMHGDKKYHTGASDRSMKENMHGDKKYHTGASDRSMMKDKTAPVYNEALNPKQIDYPNILGFNDLHIHAIRHLDVDKSVGTVEDLLQTKVHHHCKVYDDMTAACLLFPTGMTDQDKPYGIEYIITSDQYQELSDNEKQLWHYHKTELPRAQATFPDLTDAQLAELQPVIDETYGKVYYFWNYGDTYPIGEPSILVVQDIPDQ